MSSIFACGKMPALAQSMSMPPWRSAAALAIASRSASFVTSAAKAEAPLPSSLRRRLGLIGVPRDDQHLRAVPGEHAGDALADALARAGDDDRFSRRSTSAFLSSLLIVRSGHCLPALSARPPDERDQRRSRRAG